MKPVRIALAAVVVIVMGVAILGIGMGDAPKSEEPAPTGAALKASASRIAAGGKQVQEGRKEFESEGCASCHAIAADGRKGVLGPRMDTYTDPAADVLKNITMPRSDIAQGYEANLMPTNYAKKMSKAELSAVVAYIQAASGKAKDGKG